MVSQPLWIAPSPQVFTLDAAYAGPPSHNCCFQQRVANVFDTALPRQSARIDQRSGATAWGARPRIKQFSSAYRS